MTEMETVTVTSKLAFNQSIYGHHTKHVINQIS